MKGLVFGIKRRLTDKADTGIGADLGSRVASGRKESSDQEHANGTGASGKEEQESAANLVDNGSTGQSTSEGSDRVDKVEYTLTVRVGDAGVEQEDGQKVGDEAVTRELSPAGYHDTESET